MDKFTASNGYTLDTMRGGLIIRDRGGILVHNLGKYSAEAVREFVQAKHDEELGRWRWPLDPDYVVYPREDYVQVLHEPDGASGLLGSWTREQAFKFNEGGNLLGLAAEDYFEAHAERKDWEDAKEGDVWVVSIEGQGEIAMQVDAESLFRTIPGGSVVMDTWFTAARRIYPEVADVD